MTAPGLHHLDLAGRSSLIPARKSLFEAVSAIVARDPSLRQERLSGIHNPWGQAIGFTDPWAFLDACESAPVLEAARKILGPDFILWDSELYCETRSYAAFLREGREGRYWPVTPLAGCVVLMAAGRARPGVNAVALDRLGPAALAGYDPGEPLYVIRLMPATSHFERDPEHAAHRQCMEEQVLVNYANRPLWLLSGLDRANNDLVTGFAQAVPTWAVGSSSAKEKEN